MTNFNSLYVRGAALILASMAVQWLSTSLLFGMPTLSGSFAMLGFALAAIGVGIILVGCWHQVDSTRRLTD